MIVVPLWSFLSDAGRDVIREWADGCRLPTMVRATLDQKLDVLRRQPLELLSHTKLLRGPINKDIYKLRLNGSIAVRVMLCRGPLPGDVSGYTLLLGATERDDTLRPPDAIDRAIANRKTLLTNPLRRQPYERLGKDRTT